VHKRQDAKNALRKKKKKSLNFVPGGEDRGEGSLGDRQEMMQGGLQTQGLGKRRLKQVSWSGIIAGGKVGVIRPVSPPPLRRGTLRRRRAKEEFLTFD